MGGVVTSWQLVSPDILVAGAPRTIVSGRGWVVWQLRPALRGLAVTGILGPTVVDEVFAVCDVILATAGGRFDLLTDLQGVSIPLTDASPLCRVQEHLGRIVGTAARRLGRQATVLGSDWAQPFWRGLVAHPAVPWPSAVFTDAQTAWESLGVTADVAADVQGACRAGLEPTTVVLAIERVLRAEPRLDLEAVARRLGRSTRSLQRLLAGCGEGFGSLRRRVRLERARVLLTHTTLKVEAVASEVGFASPTYFNDWFVRHGGGPPGAFRGAPEAGAPDDDVGRAPRGRRAQGAVR